MILILAGLLLFIAFLVHVIWWRYSMPVSTTAALLLVFTGVPCVAAIVYFWFPASVTMSLSEVVSFVLLYISCALVYTILYSAIEQQSPTLAIINYIDRQGASGCEDASLMRYLSPDEAIRNRLALMEQGGWITNRVNWHLTDKGRRTARMFATAAGIFGLQGGG